MEARNRPIVARLDHTELAGILALHRNRGDGDVGTALHVMLQHGADDAVAAQQDAVLADRGGKMAVAELRVLAERLVPDQRDAVVLTVFEGLTAAEAAGIRPIVGIEIELVDSAAPDPAGIVVGDLVVAERGDQAIVDGTLVGDGRVELDESLLTGESVPVSRATGEPVLSGTLVVRGQGRATVTATGRKSRIGQIGQALRDIEHAGVRIPAGTSLILGMVAAGRDEIVSTQAIETFGRHLLAGRHLIIAGARHELLQEQDHYRAQFWAAFDAFVPGTPLYG